MAEPLFCWRIVALCDFSFAGCEGQAVFNIVSRCERPGETANAVSEEPRMELTLKRSRQRGVREKAALMRKGASFSPSHFQANRPPRVVLFEPTLSPHHSDSSDQ